MLEKKHKRKLFFKYNLKLSRLFACLHNGWKSLAPLLCARIGAAILVLEAPWQFTTKMAKIFPSIRKVIATIFSNLKGMLLIGYFAKSQTVNRTCFAVLLTKLKVPITCKDSKKSAIPTWLSLSHSNRIGRKKLDQLWFPVVLQPSYSLHSSLADFHLFPKLRLLFTGRKFKSDEEVITEIEQSFAVATVTSIYVKLWTKSY